MLVFLFLGHRYPPVVETTDFPVPVATERSTMDTVCSQALLVPSGSLPQVDSFAVVVYVYLWELVDFFPFEVMAQ